MVANQNKIDNQLWELQKACSKYKAVNPLADWVLFAVSRYISTGRATRQFEYDFVNFPIEKMGILVEKCLDRGKSDDEIIKAVKKIIR